MVISFEEKDRKVIESQGISVIEFKRILYKIEKRIRDDWTALQNLAEDLAKKIIKSMKFFKDKLLEMADSMKLLFEEIREVYHYPVSLRYRFVKVLSKCTGIKKQKMWKMTRHTWLARSCC